jgi:hypothetical protein
LYQQTVYLPKAFQLPKGKSPLPQIAAPLENSFIEEAAKELRGI